jgi:hypothetical protein
LGTLALVGSAALFALCASANKKGRARSRVLSPPEPEPETTPQPELVAV